MENLATDEVNNNTANSDLEWPLGGGSGMKDLRNRVNCWRLDVDASNPATSGVMSGSSSSSSSSTGSTASRGTRRSNNNPSNSAASVVRSHSGPYSWHRRPRPRSFNNVVNYNGPAVGFVVPQFGGHHQPGDGYGRMPLDLSPTCRVPPPEGDSSRASLKTPSIRGVPVGPGSDLPHPERNPLITHQPEIAKEEYHRMLCLFNRLNAERRKAEVRLVQSSSSSSSLSHPNYCSMAAAVDSARQHLMDVGTTIQHVIVAAQYVVDYSHSHGWDIDFDALLYDDAIPPVKMLPSRMRELVCSSAAAVTAHGATNAGWHLQPAA